MTTDRIHITGLRVECIIGINDWERVTKQEVIIDITLHADLTARANQTISKTPLTTGTSARPYRRMSRRRHMD